MLSEGWVLTFTLRRVAQSTGQQLRLCDAAPQDHASVGEQCCCLVALSRVDRPKLNLKTLINRLTSGRAKR